MNQPVCIRFIAGMLLIASLLSSCASIFSGASSRSIESEHGVPNLNAAYNKPYKVQGIVYYPLKSSAGYREIGNASWYGSESGNRTAMGTRFTPHALTAAHKTLPLPSRVRVTNLSNGRHVDVTMNDRGPFKKDRIIDLSRGAARKIGLHGVIKVRIEHLDSKISQKN
jgi:rare lipoprotein A